MGEELFGLAVVGDCRVNKLSLANSICERRFFAFLSSFLPVRSALKSKLLYVVELDIGKDDCSRAALSAGTELCGLFAEADSSLFVDGDRPWIRVK